MVKTEILNQAANFALQSERPTFFEGKIKGFAEEVAKKILLVEHLPHPDCMIYAPSGKSYAHTIESLISLQKEALRLPHSAPRIVLMIDEADKMPVIASQTLLKLLEEPPLTTLFILIAESRHKILPTILSRCQLMPIALERSTGALKEPLLQFLEQGRFVSLFKMQERIEPLADYFEEEESRQEAISLFFSTLLAWFRDKELLSIDPDSPHLLLPEKKQEVQKGQAIPLEKLFKAVDHAKLSFERFTPPRQVIESLFIEIGVLA